MKGKLLLAEAATGHPDGTISMLRVGINQVWGPGPQYGLQGTLVARIEGEPADAGTNHTVDLRCMAMDGQDVMPKLQGQFQVPRGGAVHNLIMQFGTAFPKAGRYTFAVRVDNIVLDTYDFTVHQGPPPKKEAK